MAFRLSIVCVASLSHRDDMLLPLCRCAVVRLRQHYKRECRPYLISMTRGHSALCKLTVSASPTIPGRLRSVRTMAICRPEGSSAEKGSMLRLSIIHYPCCARGSKQILRSYCTIAQWPLDEPTPAVARLFAKYLAGARTEKYENSIAYMTPMKYTRHNKNI